ncbi:MAG: NADH-quinone oxidoreductase subunit L, partial [Geodermatophilaceae bacterium]|nr:NADH-quinone oxidoreductase subunit L [Geodermatophilaceae bacterium]
TSTWFASWLALEPIALRVTVRPVIRVAHALAVIDDRVLDRAVDGSAALTRRAADRVLSRGEAWVDGSVGAIARLTAALGRLARRPQTGQLHQYYAQAAAALAVLGLVIVLVR